MCSQARIVASRDHYMKAVRNESDEEWGQVIRNRQSPVREGNVPSFPCARVLAVANDLRSINSPTENWISHAIEPFRKTQPRLLGDFDHSGVLSRNEGDLLVSKRAGLSRQRNGRPDSFVPTYIVRPSLPL